MQGRWGMFRIRMFISGGHCSNFEQQRIKNNTLWTMNHKLWEKSTDQGLYSFRVVPFAVTQYAVPCAVCGLASWSLQYRMQIFSTVYSLIFVIPSNSSLCTRVVIDNYEYVLTCIQGVFMIIHQYKNRGCEYSWIFSIFFWKFFMQIIHPHHYMPVQYSSSLGRANSCDWLFTRKIKTLNISGNVFLLPSSLSFFFIFLCNCMESSFDYMTLTAFLFLSEPKHTNKLPSNRQRKTSQQHKRRRIKTTTALPTRRSDFSQHGTTITPKNFIVKSILKFPPAKSYNNSLFFRQPSAETSFLCHKQQT